MRTYLHMLAVAVAALLLTAPAPLSAGDAAAAAAAGDPERGEEIYARCKGCHSIDRNRIGPMHRGLFGRAAGGVEGFNYSTPMKESGIVWNETTLDAFLAAPREMVPGTRMTYAGIPDPQDRADLIAYLKAATQ